MRIIKSNPKTSRFIFSKSEFLQKNLEFILLERLLKGKTNSVFINFNPRSAIKKDLRLILKIRKLPKVENWKISRMF